DDQRRLATDPSGGSGSRRHWGSHPDRRMDLARHSSRPGGRLLMSTSPAIGLCSEEPAIEFRLLGVLEAQAGDRRVLPSAGKQRSLLALLLLDAGRSVSTEAIIDSLWDVSHPSGAEHAIEVYVSGLRKRLAAVGFGGLLPRRGSGYAIAIDP